MITVRISKSWKQPDWFRQTPGGHGLWGDCRFTEESVPDPDFLIVCNHVHTDLRLTIDPSRVWLLLQEPPVPAYRWIRPSYTDYGRVLGPDPTLDRTSPADRTHGCLPWHVGKTYDELRAAPPPTKTTDLVWITSNQRVHPGHRKRMHFLAHLRQEAPVEVYGRGIRPIDDKWTALAPARYALAIENHSSPHYWTEKIADCFLAGAMPLYWGAPNIADYFPAESFVWIDITDRHAAKQVAEILRSDRAERHREAIQEARRRVLEQHQFFPAMHRAIAAHLALHPTAVPREHTVHRTTDLTHYYSSTPRWLQLSHGLRRRLGLSP